MIEARELSFSYGRTEILKNISLKLSKGRLYAVIGPNGSGKTTLIRLLSKLSKAADNSLFLEGKPYEKIDRKAFAKQVALLPQGRNVPSISVYDLVACGRFPHLDFSRRLNEEDRRAVDSALEATGACAFKNKSVKRLSGGERQRVYIAMLLAQATPFVLLDEPTTHLDISAKFDVMKLLCDIRNSGKCVVAVLHDLELALKYADEIILMSKGEIVSMGAPDEAVENKKLESVFGVKCESITLNGQTVFHFDENKN